MCMAAPSSCPYSPKCLEEAFSEVRIAEVLRLWPPWPRSASLGYYLTSPDFLIIPIGLAPPHGGSWPVGPRLCGLAQELSEIQKEWWYFLQRISV